MNSTVWILFFAAMVVAWIIFLQFRNKSIQDQTKRTMHDEEGKAIKGYETRRASDRSFGDFFAQYPILPSAFGLLAYGATVYLLLIKSWAGSFLGGPTILAKLFYAAALFGFALALIDYKNVKKMALKAVFWTVGILVSLLLVMVLFPSQFRQASFAGDKEIEVKVYKAYEPVSTVMVDAARFTQAVSDSFARTESPHPDSAFSEIYIRPSDTLYYVMVPFRREAVEVRNMRLEKGDRLDPLFTIVINPYLPGKFHNLTLTGLGAVEAIQTNGRPLYLGVQNMPAAKNWIARHTTHDHSISDLFVRNDPLYTPFAKNDNSVFASLQMQLNGNWEYVLPPLIFPPADSAQPILLGVNLQRGVGHESAGGWYRLVFRIQHPLVDSMAIAKR